jgi:hypothetical protein
VIAVGNGEASMLKNAGVVGEDLQMVEARCRELEVAGQDRDRRGRPLGASSALPATRASKL